MLYIEAISKESYLSVVPARETDQIPTALDRQGSRGYTTYLQCIEAVSNDFGQTPGHHQARQIQLHIPGTHSEEQCSVVGGSMKMCGTWPRRRIVWL